MNRKDMVLLFLQASPGRPIKGRSLAEMVGCNKRDIRSITFDLTKDGHPVVAGNEGYWLGNSDDCGEYSRRLTLHSKRQLLRGMYASRNGKRQRQLRLSGEAEGA